MFRNILGCLLTIVMFVSHNTCFADGILYAGAANGNVYSSTNDGYTWQATTIPSVGYAVNSVFATNTTLYVGSADKRVYYSTNNGSSWTSTSASPDRTAVNGVFVSSGNTIYIATAGGHVYSSINHGVNWSATKSRPGSGAVNSIFIVSPTAWYAGSANGFVYYSSNKGVSWKSINGSPDSTAIRNVYVTGSHVYVNTASQYAYSSTSLTGNGKWTFFGQTVYSLFVNSDASIMDAGTQDGYIFSLNTGDELGFITYSPINSVFFLGDI